MMHGQPHIKLLSNQLALHILSLLEKASVNPISLGWHDKKPRIDTENNLTCINNQEQPFTGT